MRNSHSDSDSEISIKSYEEILRDKALRKLMDKRKEKFYDDFEELTNEKAKNKNKKTKKYSDSDGGEYISKHNSKKSKKKNDKQSVKSSKTTDDIDDSEFSKDDAVEIGINDSPIREDLDDSLQLIDSGVNTQSSKGSKDIVKNSKEKIIDNSDDGNKVINDDAVLIIPDETTSINFSVDAGDELALELSQVEEKENKSVSKKISSVVSIVKKASSKKIFFPRI